MLINLKKTFFKIILSSFVFVTLLFSFQKSVFATNYYLDSNSDSGCSGLSTETSLVLGSERLTDGEVEIWNDANIITNWGQSAGGSSSITRESTVVYAGSYSVAVNIDGIGSNVFLYQADTLEAGNTYKISYWAKATTPFRIQLYQRGSSASSVDQQDITTMWAEYETVFTAPVDGRIEIGRLSGQGLGETFYLDNLSLKQRTGDCAWKDFSEITTLLAGDVVGLKKDGIWRNQKLTINDSGSEGNPITFESYLMEDHSRGVILTLGMLQYTN